MDPWRVLAPSGRVEKLIERELIQAADQDRQDELVGLVRGGAVLAAQTIALCLGVPWEHVKNVSEALLEVSDGE